MLHPPGTCIADENSGCAECDLEGRLICKVDKKFANKFLFLNLSYRLLAIGALILAGLIVNQWWMLITYIAVTFLTFFVLEPRLLCSHCPFYALEGKFLRCWALRGMPKLWKYRPEPISSKERKLMLLLGIFVDLFPFLVIAYGLVWFFGMFFLFQTRGNLFVLGGLIIISIAFTTLAYYLNKLLQGYACKHCANFSCAMNKVPDDIIQKFLDKNLTMKTAWENAGWESEKLV
ncbi:MAG: hypothetical protein ACFFDI_02345 [Promethearchaeota archaeon]